MKTLLKDIAAARREAFKEAKDSYRWVWSRGANIATVGADGTQCDPHPGAECYRWDGTLRSIYTVLEDIRRNHDNVAEVVVEGGYDGGDTMADREFNYEPWVSSWSVTVWKRDS